MSNGISITISRTMKIYLSLIYQPIRNFQIQGTISFDEWNEFFIQHLKITKNIIQQISFFSYLIVTLFTFLRLAVAVGKKSKQFHTNKWYCMIIQLCDWWPFLANRTLYTILIVGLHVVTPKWELVSVATCWWQVRPSVDEVVAIRVSGLPLHDIGLRRLIRQWYSRYLRKHQAISTEQHGRVLLTTL